MSYNWGDYNGDGKTDYVDYKIFTTQVNPYSGEYQDDAHNVMQEYQRQYYKPVRNHLSFGEWVFNFVAVVVILFVVFSLDLDSEMTAIVSMGLIIVVALISASIKNKKSNSKDK